MKYDSQSIRAAVVFEREARAEALVRLVEARLGCLWARLEEIEADVARRRAGERWARSFGFDDAFAPLFQVLVFSPERDLRDRAAAAVIRSLKRTSREVA